MEGILKIFSPVNSDYPTSVGIDSNIPVNITLAISDVREPDKRNSSFSKTITLPGTKETNILFEHIFDVTTTLSNFNPNLKTQCEYYVGTERIFEGDLQLLRILKKGISPTVEIRYEVSIVGRLANVFIDLGNALLTDLDFSDLDVAFTYPNIATGWGGYTPGVGYVFPLIDYGVMGGNSSQWYIQHLKPAIFEKEYIDRIFESIGKTFSGTFFGGAYHNQIVIPDVNEGQLKMTAAQSNALSFYAGKTAAPTTYTLPLTYTIAGWAYFPGIPQVTVGQLVYSDDTNLPFYDGGAVYDTATNTFTTGANTDYKFATSCDFDAQINLPAGAVYAVIANTDYTFMVDIYNVTSNAIIASTSVTTTPVAGSYTNFSISVQLPNAYSLAGQQYYCRLRTDDANALQTLFYDAGLNPVTTGSASITVRQKFGSWYSCAPSTGALPLGYTISMNQTIPKNVKQIDFLMSVIKAENLYMELDLTDSNNYIIEKRNDFFITPTASVSTYNDWTSKWDYERETVVIPMGELDFREYDFTYKKDGDKFNKLYFDEFNEVYGQEQIYVDNDFNKTIKKNELVFAATPLVGNSVNNLVTPVIAQIDGSNVKPMAAIIRRLYYGGLINCDPYQLNLGNGFATATQYPYAGHLDTPYSPTIDLCWDNPKKLYYDFPAITYTNNNLYVRNWQKFIEQITDQNSKIVIMWMYLKPTDIANFTFRKQVWVYDSWYLVNKITNYNPTTPESCQVEMIRLAYVDDPVTETINLWNNGEGGTTGFQYGMQVVGGGENPLGNDNNPSGLSVGENNVNQGEGGNIFGGEQNFIGGISDGAITSL